MAVALGGVWVTLLRGGEKTHSESFVIFTGVLTAAAAQYEGSI